MLVNANYSMQLQRTIRNGETVIVSTIDAHIRFSVKVNIETQEEADEFRAAMLAKAIKQVYPGFRPLDIKTA